MEFDRVRGTDLVIDVTWSDTTGVRTHVRQAPNLDHWDTIRALVDRPLTVEQAAVAITSLAEVIDPTGDAVTVLSVDADTVTVEDRGETREWYLANMRPSMALLRVIAQRYGRGVTLGDD